MDRETWPNGYWKPQDGDEVYQMVRGFGGSPAYIYGIIIKRGANLRVKVSHSASIMNVGAAKSGKTYPITPQWVVKGDPKVKQKEIEKQQAAQAEKEAEKVREQRKEDAVKALEREGKRLHKWTDAQVGDIVATIGGWDDPVRMEYEVTGFEDFKSGTAAMGIELVPSRGHTPVILGKADNFVVLKRKHEDRSVAVMDSTGLLHVMSEVSNGFSGIGS